MSAADQIISVLAGARGRRVQVAAEHAELPPREHHRQTVGRAGAHHHGARRGQERGLQPEVVQFFPLTIKLEQCNVGFCSLGQMGLKKIIK